MIGQWAIKEGALEVQDNAFTYLSFDRKVKGPVRVEFDVRRSPDLKAVPTTGPMLAVTLTKGHEVGDRVLWRTPTGCGYMLCLGWHNRKSNRDLAGIGRRWRFPRMARSWTRPMAGITR